MTKTTLTATALSFGVLALGTVAQPAFAQVLTAGFASEPSSVDPLYHNLGPNNATRKHMFEALVGEVGGDFSIKLEDQVLITETGYENLTLYPFDAALMGQI